MIHGLTTGRQVLADLIRGLVAPSVDPTVTAAREAAVVAVGEHAAATIPQLGALAGRARDPRAGLVGTRLVSAALRRGIDAHRANELLAHLRSRRRPPA